MFHLLKVGTEVETTFTWTSGLELNLGIEREEFKECYKNVDDLNTSPYKTMG